MIPLSLFQFDIAPSSLGEIESSPWWSDLLSNQDIIALLVLLGFVAAVVGILFVTRWTFLRRGRFRAAFGMKVLLIRVLNSRFRN